MNRKNIFVSATLLLLTMSCSSNNNDDSTSPNNQKNDLSIKIDFVGSSTASDLTNVQVGDTLLSIRLLLILQRPIITSHHRPQMQPSTKELMMISNCILKKQNILR
ncbi:hypothetical protein SAMN05660477_00166 [Soonwooa buanensis]|uniref:Uncharacterized protein n=1 Tax=Soonwooa buanensis TaxID=619805 RepID=A0A1T5CML8_9FLAO|nr:hypothetical protein [Soonwooa buanensis]SKB60400.1 hypothetical protein SAMN05660477_00166 [Soonwooa buanensis]